MGALRTPGGVSGAEGGRLPPPSSRWSSPLSPEAELCTPTAVSLSPRASGGGHDSFPDSVRVHTPQRWGREAEGEGQQGEGRERQDGGDSHGVRGAGRRNSGNERDGDGDRSKGGRTGVGRGALHRRGSPVGGRLFHRSSGLCPEAQRGAALSLQPHSMWGQERQQTQTSGLTGAESWLCLVLTLGCACWVCR